MTTYFNGKPVRRTPRKQAAPRPAPADTTRRTTPADTTRQPSIVSREQGRRTGADYRRGAQERAATLRELQGDSTPPSKPGLLSKLKELRKRNRGGS